LALRGGHHRIGAKANPARKPAGRVLRSNLGSGTLRPNEFTGLDDLEQKQNENDGKNEAQSAASVITQARPHAISSKTKHQNQNDKQNKHSFPPREHTTQDCDAICALNVSRLTSFGANTPLHKKSHPKQYEVSMRSRKHAQTAPSPVPVALLLIDVLTTFQFPDGDAILRRALKIRQR